MGKQIRSWTEEVTVGDFQLLEFFLSQGTEMELMRENLMIVLWWNLLAAVTFLLSPYMFSAFSIDSASAVDSRAIGKSESLSFLSVIVLEY
jgi:hypothetical protein